MSFKYWNDMDIEKAKPYWIEDVSDMKLLNFLQYETNLQKCLLDGIKFAEQFKEGVKGNVLDIGAGVAWTSAIISRIEKVESITATDFSEHRLKKIAPIVFNQLNGIETKFKTIIGDFQEMDFDMNCYQTIIFCQSLYMFPDLNKILDKVRELLSEDGILLVIGERITPEYPFLSINYLKKRMKKLLMGRTDISGNYFYEDKDYKNAIQKAGLTYEFQLLDYPVYPKSSAWKAGNHFGIKRKGFN